MALTINTNVASLNAQRNLNTTQNALSKSMERLSSGLRINSAADDAAGLAISVGMTQLALRRASDPKQVEDLVRSLTASQQLLGLIQEILEFSQLGAGQLTLEDHDFLLADVVGETVSAYEAAASSKRLSLHSEVDPELPKTLRGDAMRLKQVLGYFVDNAIKFSERGIIVLTVSADAADDQSALLRFEVADEGIGIAPEHAAGLFKAFAQVDDSLNRPYGGTGLGLVMARRIASLMGGDAGLSSPTGRGARFWATARLRRPPSS